MARFRPPISGLWACIATILKSRSWPRQSGVVPAKPYKIKERPISIREPVCEKKLFFFPAFRVLFMEHKENSQKKSICNLHRSCEFPLVFRWKNKSESTPFREPTLESAFLWCGLQEWLLRQAPALAKKTPQNLGLLGQSKAVKMTHLLIQSFGTRKHAKGYDHWQRNCFQIHSKRGCELIPPSLKIVTVIGHNDEWGLREFHLVLWIRPAVTYAISSRVLRIIHAPESQLCTSVGPCSRHRRIHIM